METVRTRRCGESGQTMILMALLLGVVIGFVAMVADVGFMLYERRALQNAADAAALAGAQELGESPSAAVAMAQQYALANGVDATSADYTFLATTPYGGDSEAIEVVVTGKVGFLFGPVLGLGFGNVSARAVAGMTGGANYAIFVGPSCSDDDGDGEGELEGGNIFIDGAVYAADLEIEGDFVEVTRAVHYLCDLDVDADNPVFGSGPTQLSQEPPPPVSYTTYSDFDFAYFSYSDFNCTFSISGNLEIDEDTPEYWLNDDPDTGTLKPGTYCATGEIEIHGNDDGIVNGNVTFVSHEEIEFHSDVDNFNFTAFEKDVLAFTDGEEDGDGEGEIDFDEGPGVRSGQWFGMLLAPNGEIELKGENLTSTGTFLFAGEEIEIEGDSFDLTAYQDGVLAFSGGAEDGDDEGEIEIEGNDGQWTGMILAPFGEIELEGDDLTSSGTLLFAGEELEIEGDNIDLTAMTGPGASGITVRLVE